MKDTLIVLIGYKRPDKFHRLIQQVLAYNEGDIAVLIDYYNDQVLSEMQAAVNHQRVTKVVCRTRNYGCRKNILAGLEELSQLSYQYFIVLEDDLIFNKSLFEYFRKTRPYLINQVVNIGAFNFMTFLNSRPSVFQTSRFTSWGWMTTKDKLCEFIEWSKLPFVEHDRIHRFRMYLKCGHDIPKMIRDQRRGRIDSWAVSYVEWMYLNKYKAIIPIKSFVINDGFGRNSTHTFAEWPLQPKECAVEVKGDIVRKSSFSFGNFLWLFNYSIFIRIIRKLITPC